METVKLNIHSNSFTQSQLNNGLSLELIVLCEVNVDGISSVVLRGVSHEGRLIGREACNQEQEGNRDTS